MPAYQSAADRTCGRVAWSVSTSTVEQTAITSHASRNVRTSPAAGTICMPSRKNVKAAQDVREPAAPRA